MALNSQWGTTYAGTQADPFPIEDAADWDAVDAADLSDGSIYFIFVNDVAYSGEPSRITFYGDLNLDGFAFSDINGFEFGSLFNDLYGNIHDGEINFNVTTNDGGAEALVNTFRGSGVFDSINFTGTITTSGTGDANIIRTLQSSNISKCLFDVTLTSVDGDASIVGGGTTQTLDKLVNVGAMSATGTGTAYAFSAETNLTLTNSFYDSTVNPSVSDVTGATGKSTTDLQLLDTYTNTATVGLTSAYDMVAINTYVDETWAIDDGNAYPVLGWSVTPAQFVNGTITLSGVAQANAVVDIISCPKVSEGTKTIVEQVTANGSGVYTATVERNTALNYWAEPRHYVEEFTGTLTPVSGTTFSTGVDLSGVSIGGANDPLYVLKSTGGTASGNEVVVESRSGNDITLSYDPGFDGTTTFSLGKAYGTNTVLARSTVS